jgi:hypothetical protein
VATYTVAALTGLVESEAVAIKFKTFSFFAIAEDFFVWVQLHRCDTVGFGFGVSVPDFVLSFDS